MATKNLGKVIPEKGVDYFTDEDIQSLNIPKNTSDLNNDSEFATETYVKNQIANAQLGGETGEVDLSGYATKDELHNHSNKDILDNISSDDIEKWNAGGDVDLSDYATKEYVDNEISSALVDLPSSGAEGCVTGVGITTIMAITQNDYDNLVLFGTVDDSTLYIIKPESDAEELNMIPYLTSDGQAYINLGIAPIDGASYEVCFRAPDGINSGGVFGDRWTNISGAGGSGTANWMSGSYNGSSYASYGKGAVDITKKRIFTLTPNSLILDNDITTEITAGTTNKVRNIMYLFAKNVADQAGASYLAGVAAFTFFYMKIYDADGNPLYYYIPAKDENGVACIFEAVNKTYLYNASDTGEFVYGEELEES